MSALLLSPLPFSLSLCLFLCSFCALFKYRVWFNKRWRRKCIWKFALRTRITEARFPSKVRVRLRWVNILLLPPPPSSSPSSCSSFSLSCCYWRLSALDDGIFDASVYCLAVKGQQTNNAATRSDAFCSGAWQHLKVCNYNWPSLGRSPRRSLTSRRSWSAAHLSS